MAPFFVSNYQVITMRHFLIGFALVCAVGFGGEAFAATYEVTADSVVDIEYSHDSHYKGQAWYKAKDLNTGQTRYFRKPVSIPAVPPSRPPMAMIPDSKRVATIGKAGGSAAVKASRLNGIAISAWLAAEAAGWVIDELSGQVTGPPTHSPVTTLYYAQYANGNGFKSKSYQDVLDYQYSCGTYGCPTNIKAPVCISGTPEQCYRWKQEFEYQNLPGNINSWLAYGFACNGNAICDESTLPGETVDDQEVFEQVIEPALQSNPSQSDLSRVVSDLNAKPYNFPAVKLGAEAVVADLQAEGHTATTPHSSSPEVHDSDHGDRVSSVSPGTGEYDPSAPQDLPTDYARENTLQAIKDSLDLDTPVPGDPVLDLSIPESPITDWSLDQEHSTFWSWLRGTFPFSLLTSPLAAISADTPPAPQFCYTAVGIEKCHSMSMWDPLFSAIRFAEGLLLIFGFYLVMVRAVMRFGG